jgi:precorrin-6x reductase
MISMNDRVMLFAGTAEGHLLCRWLKEEKIYADVFTATEYGTDILRVDGMGSGDGIVLHAGRLTEDEMTACMKKIHPLCIVDATHPYAEEATANIRKAASDAGIPFLRVLREEEEIPEENVIRVPDMKTAASRAAEIQGNILLTTGSKELMIFKGIPDYRNRVYARVLPGSMSEKLCREAGFPENHIIRMQGPFTEEENLEVIRQYGISGLVTKETGKAGGFGEKINAARKSGCRVISIRRPKEEGLGIDEVKEQILKLIMPVRESEASGEQKS